MTHLNESYQDKYVTNIEVTHYGDEKKFSVTKYYDLTKEMPEDELRDLIEYDIEILRVLLFNKFKDIPRGEQYNKKMDGLIKLVEAY